ncbi:MAG: hypothetical protein ACKO3P_12320, partial [Planctomycetaceae bacterium]
LIAGFTDSLTGGSSTLASSLVQGLYNTATGGTFVLSLNDGTATVASASLDWDASADDIVSAIQTALGSPVAVTVTGAGTLNSPWIITPPSGSTQTLIAGVTDSLTGGSSTLTSVSQSLSNTATGGSFVLSLTANGQTLTTAALPYNATADAIASAIQSVSGVATTVTGSGTTADPWVITPTYGQSIITIQPGVGFVYSVDPGLSDGTAVVYQEVAGKPIAGLVDGQTYYVFNQVNPFFQTNYPQYVLGLSTTQTSPTLVAFNLTQSFTDSQGNTYPVAGFDGVNDYVSLLLPASTTASVSMNSSNLSGGTATLTSLGAGVVQLWNTATGGTFTLSATPSAGGAIQTTTALGYNATAAEVAAALNALSGLSVTVTGSGEATAPWKITGTGFSDLTANDSLSGGSSMLDVVTALELWN